MDLFPLRSSCTLGLEVVSSQPLLQEMVRPRQCEGLRSPSQVGCSPLTKQAQKIPLQA
jgi:hypothetical protein